MTDLEMVRLCAEAMGLKVRQYCLGNDPDSPGAVLRWTFMKGNVEKFYDPLHDDAQAMGLVVKHRVCAVPVLGDKWSVYVAVGIDPMYRAIAANLNRAIVECVAKMQQAKCARS